MKKLFRQIITKKLEKQIIKLRTNQDFKIIAVVGSVGKTSTKNAIVTVLSQKYKVLSQDGNYNVPVSVPLVFLEQKVPASIMNPLAWMKILRIAKKKASADFGYDYVVLELGTEEPGEISQFAYLKPDIAVVTAVSDEHMQNFTSLDAVAAEELTVGQYAKRLLINADDVASQYRAGLSCELYGTSGSEDYSIQSDAGFPVQKVQLSMGDMHLSAELSICGAQGQKIALAAAAVAKMCGLDQETIQNGLGSIVPTSGRMQILEGQKGSIIIDDTYNASPLAVKAALEVLYGAHNAVSGQKTQRVALLGNMNELGETSKDSHSTVGDFCDPTRLDLVVTLGKDANEHLARAAEARGCKVVRAESPVQAAQAILTALNEGAVILCKGSQNGVFAEEAVKLLLKDPADKAKLVRQTDAWLNKKRAQFSDIAP